MSKSNTPILVANTEWDLPENIIKYVQAERMINGLIGITTPLSPEESVGFAEVVAYIMPETSRRPLPPSITKIYLYCVTQLMKQQKIKVPNEIAVNELDDYEEQKLNDLKKYIYEKRGGEEKNPVIDSLKEVFSNPNQKDEKTFDSSSN